MDDCELALSTDLYELTMAAAYFDNHEEAYGTFELFVRSYPKNRSYLIAAGLEQAIDYLKRLRFEKKQIDFLKRHPNFKDVSSSFFKYIARFRFSGDLWAMPEGTVFFTNEPIIRVTAPIIEAQVIETYLLSIINFETLIATKASRVVQSARGRGVVEFGGRRAHGPQSALLAARASYIGGCIGTSNVLAGYKYGIPTYGTVAHSFIMTYDSEREAFERFRKTFPTTPAYLLDTYDTLEAARTVASLGVKPSLVRLDSGDRYTLSRKVRQILDEAGLKDTKIFVSGDLNEFVLDKLTARRPPIDFFGVGTDLVTSRDDPALPGIYKLVSLTRNGTTTFRAKTSTGKQTIPGAKQVRRFYSHGKIRLDLITLGDEEPASRGKPLLTQIMKRGRVVVGMPSLDRIQEKTRTELSSLPIKYRALYGTVKPPIRLSPRLVELTSSLWKRTR
jgi:nicotinate phosphoribosyltransferase